MPSSEAAASLPMPRPMPMTARPAPMPAERNARAMLVMCGASFVRLQDSLLGGVVQCPSGATSGVPGLVESVRVLFFRGAVMAHLDALAEVQRGEQREDV